MAKLKTAPRAKFPPAKIGGKLSATSAAKIRTKANRILGK